MKKVPNENNEKKIGKRKPFWLLIPVFFVLLIFVLFRFVFILGYVPTESMEPTISKESMVLGVRVYGELDVGDIVIFDKDGELMVKRIAARGGETITVDEMVYVPLGLRASRLVVWRIDRSRMGVVFQLWLGRHACLNRCGAFV